MNTGKVADKVFPITTFLSDLPSKLFPQPLLLSSSNGPAEGRLVIIGDVHGMRKSLEALLDKVDFDQRKGDHLILAGDLVSKGPDSPGVVDLAIKLGASAVRGNHDNAVLHAAAEINATKDSLLSPGGSTGGPAELECPKVDLPGDTVQSAETQDKNASTTPGKNKRHSPATYHTASALSTRQLDWLAALPLILRIKLPEGLTSSLGDTVVVVHAGLVPNIPLEEQDPHAVMHMRSLVREMDDGNGFTPN
ncbi:Ser/Thr protein phosphatase family protein [Penicillium macrosclerotiorum]|uniref:Ser/Thr protein phosphatase family protein n=1 Tax=Penicillium macrosclerotiorum TaxID=303699 RepID=UPI0025490440|nr:Ser/Thr protein phosphatase family protein [Penicillium macrosclerotiorum]KAJ5678813.1 Ser/Thr protein phosphatase family protein [Penicillium macrosclerotiorum]